jgi:hypothetical protein
MKRDLFEITDSINKLEKNLKYCQPYNCFGNDNRIQIKIMLEVIKMDRSKSWIYSKYLNSDELLQEHPDNYMWQAAMDARDWLDGKFEIDELLFSETAVSINYQTSLN